MTIITQLTQLIFLNSLFLLHQKFDNKLLSLAKNYLGYWKFAIKYTGIEDNTDRVIVVRLAWESSFYFQAWVLDQILSFTAANAYCRDHPKSTSSSKYLLEKAVLAYETYK